MLPALTALLACLAIATATAITKPDPPCSNIPKPHIPGAIILSITSTPLKNHTVAAAPPILNTNITVHDICSVSITLRHPPANDTVHVQIWLPSPSAWNTRLISLGGSAWAAGHGPLTLAPYSAQGFAAASTDAGLDGNLLSPAGWALTPSGEINTPLLTNFASHSILDMWLAAKQVTASYYRTPASYSYFEGCSTGGRQGLVAAQKYPGAFDGILAGAPAIYWTKYVVAELWPQVVMKERGYFPSACEFQVARQKVVEACDGLDGVKDGVVSDVEGCARRFRAEELVGKRGVCPGGEEVVLTRELADVVERIWEGPKKADGSRLWYGLGVGSPLESLAATEVVNGTRTGVPFSVAADWVRYFVKAKGAFDVGAIDSVVLRGIFAESVEKFEEIIDSSNPDLSAFKRSGGKLMVWHGESDNIIFPQDSVQYRKEVQERLGAGSDVDSFFRLFMAPGVDHCGLGSIDGAGPTNPLGSLIDWVEKGKAPRELAAATLPTAKSQFTRKICSYPLVAKFDGRGDPAAASSYRCTKN